MAAEVQSLRPGGASGISLRPGGGGAFNMTSFAQGARPQPSSAKEEKGHDDVIKYDRTIMMAFKERCTAMPAELEQSGSEIVIIEGQTYEDFEDRMQDAKTSSAGAAAEPDGRDWRSRAEPQGDKPSNGGGGREGGGNRRGGGDRDHNWGGQKSASDMQPLAPGEAGAEIIKAANPWTRAGPSDENERLLRSVKSILNKITPEKFERLMEQMLELGIDTAEKLRASISLVFDKAIWEPTFCSLYAEVCVRLSNHLPEFPAAEGEDKPMTFRRVLLNTCQEEFEGAAAAKAALGSITSAQEREAAERKCKLRTMGNIKLIGELYKKKMVVEKILHSCVGELFGSNTKVDPPEENVEAVVNLLTTVGKDLDASPRSTTYVEQYFARLAQLSQSKKLASRMRFLCKDLIDLRKNKWTPRREKLEAKTLDEVHADAAVALGIAKPQAEEQSLFPEGPNGPDADGWSVAGKKGKPGAGGGPAGEGFSSALTGAYVPPPKPSERAPRKAKEEAAPEAAATPAAAAEKRPAAKKTKLTAEELDEECQKLLNEYNSAADVAEALMVVQGLEERSTDAAATRSAICKAAVQKVIDDSTERLAEIVLKLLAHLATAGKFGGAMVCGVLDGFVAQLEDLAIDVPKAPKLLGVIVAGLVAQKLAPAGYLRSACERVEDMFARRDFAVAVLLELKEQAAAVAAEPPVAEYLVDGDNDLASLKELFTKKGLKVTL